MLPYKKEIDKYMQILKEKLNPKLIILHGSIARGTFGVGSDVDILVISDELPKNFNKRLKLLYLLDETSAPIDIKGYTTKEFQRMILKGHPLALDALEEGIVLFADEDYLRDIKKLFVHAKKKFKRIEKGWMRIER